jgi:YD repeat-containing protein
VEEVTYGDLDTILEYKDAKGYTTKGEYDSFGNLTKIISPTGSVVTKSYDAI